LIAEKSEKSEMGWFRGLQRRGTVLMMGAARWRRPHGTAALPGPAPGLGDRLVTRGVPEISEKSERW